MAIHIFHSRIDMSTHTSAKAHLPKLFGKVCKELLLKEINSFAKKGSKATSKNLVGLPSREESHSPPNVKFGKPSTQKCHWVEDMFDFPGGLVSVHVFCCGWVWRCPP